MSANRFDVIVAGVGGMGSATIFELARRGLRVLGIEQFDLVHVLGSSHGHTRVIRKAYYEHPNYVPLLHRAYERWYDLEQQTGKRLLVECGCLNIGPESSELIQGVRHACAEHKLPVEQLAAADIRRRYPPLQFDEPYVGILEREAGFLYVEECVRAHIEAGSRFGATIRPNETVIQWTCSGGGVSVETDRDTYHAGRLVITAGPWATNLLAQLRVPLTVMRQVPHWFGTTDDAWFRRDRFPIYMADTPGGYYYGVPVIDANGHKIARHYGQPELSGPEHIAREVRAEDETDVRAFLSRHVPAANGPRRHASVCIYTLTPDRHFILDRHPEHEQIAIAAGFSGHGFKFATVVGEIMADFAESGRTAHPIDMFRLSRFGSNG